MMICKHCGNSNVVKNGIIQGKQRYLCKACNRTSRAGDIRARYSIEQKIMAIKLYTEGMGIRAISRVQNISAPLIVGWIRHFGQIIRDKLSSTRVPDECKDIEILEIDELFTYYQKKHKKPTFGLLWTETGIKLLILR